MRLAVLFASCLQGSVAAICLWLTFPTKYHLLLPRIFYLIIVTRYGWLIKQQVTASFWSLLFGLRSQVLYLMHPSFPVRGGFLRMPLDPLKRRSSDLHSETKRSVRLCSHRCCNHLKAQRKLHSQVLLFGSGLRKSPCVFCVAAKTLYSKDCPVSQL